MGDRLLELIALGRPSGEVLEALVRRVEEEAEGMLCSVLLLDADGKRLRHGAAPSLPAGYCAAIDGVEIGPRAGSCGTAAYTGARVIVTDIAADPLWEAWKGLAAQHGLRACWSSPIRSPAGETLGTFAMYYRTPRAPAARELEMIARAETLAGIVLGYQRAMQDLRESEERFRSMTMLSSDFYWETDPEHRFTHVQYGDRHRSTMPRGSQIGLRRWEIPFEHPDEDGWLAHRATLDQHLPFRDFEFARRADNGEVRWYTISGEPVCDAAHVFRGYRGIGREITERKRAIETLARLAHYDTLTGLPNRALLNDRLRRSMVRAARAQTLLAVMFLDLDRFKEINDTHGHAVGDEVLREAARRLQSCLRASDTVGRLGGDEFTVLLEDVRHVDEVSRIARKMLGAFAEPFHAGGHALRVSTSIGITMFPLDDEDAESLLRNADLAMYQAKQAGRDNFQFHSHDIASRERRARAAAEGAKPPRRGSRRPRRPGPSASAPRARTGRGRRRAT